MKYSIIVLRDIKANTHLPPMFVPNINAAIRDLAEVINEPKSERTPVWARHPDDFELISCGEWDAESNYFDTPHDGSHTDTQQLVLLSTLKRS